MSLSARTPSEPDTFVTDANGTRLLEDVGIAVVAPPEYADAAREPNRHLF
ncbi:hypothetical protein ACFY9F_33295 [Streptomyces sp. NPDC012421]